MTETSKREWFAYIRISSTLGYSEINRDINEFGTARFESRKHSQDKTNSRKIFESIFLNILLKKKKIKTNNK